MRNGRVFARLLGLGRVVVEDVLVDQDGSFVVWVARGCAEAFALRGLWAAVAWL